MCLKEHMLGGSGLFTFGLVDVVQCCVLEARAFLVIVDGHIRSILRIEHR